MAEKKLRQLTVKYDGEADTDLDDRIEMFFEANGFDWYAQGFDLISDRRDIAFRER